MIRRSVLAICVVGCTAAPARAPAPVPEQGPRTRAERTGFGETSSHADVLAFLDSLVRLGAPLHVDTLGTSAEGRVIPVVVASRPRVATPDEARRLGRPVVWVQGNIHGGEVEGKEALLALLRDLSLDAAPNALDSTVLVAVPIYNTDGNERLAPQERNRSSQNGPATIGARANGQGLDLNRDYVKAEAPETRGSLALFARWDPEVFVDLHTTNGSYHGYALTYSPSLSPAAPWHAFEQDTLLPVLRRRVRERRGIETFPYGNFGRTYGAERLTDLAKDGWWTYDHRPRYGTNYVGLRGRLSILAEAYSHDPFRRRVEATDAFVREVLGWVGEHAGDVRRRARLADEAMMRLAGGAADSIPVGAALPASPPVAEVLAEELVATGDSSVTEPGVPPGIRRTGRMRTLRIPIGDRFEPERWRPLGGSYVLAAGDDSSVVVLLRRHGIAVERLPAPWSGRVERFVVDSVARAERPFQGHRETSVRGRWATAVETIPAGAWVVPVAQPLGRLAAYLLEPESDDGVVTWGVVDVEAGAPYPIGRAIDAFGAR
ncbi:MAG TPA: M14 family zinc carboxypeptidase [Gemmatimonadaceae bacterium]